LRAIAWSSSIDCKLGLSTLQATMQT